MARTRWASRPQTLLIVSLALTMLGCHADEPGNPMPPALVITGAEFADGPDLPARTAHRVRIPAERVAELRGLFDGSRIDSNPARWVYWGELKLFLKGGGTDAYTIYATRHGAGAYSDHLSRYFRGGSDAAFAGFLKKAEQTETER